ncbi:hypothetical protein CNMCM5793_002291 [Aspergillus hiratsukae]|uniref:Profilin n=1 Tax=Aspergillus hiratsukae TaxID=1194566 RepID=A0A8H6UTD6_9EURO|nr:hypothetical protein CNMCM5793_002291 [Aspergillus hiratsukae]KAF7166182.1 hypothetical protein CNMCM6106_002106 [Aspergillus hiratsukae]
MAKAAIISLLDRTVAATAPEFLQEGEVNGLLEGFKQPDSAVGSGITVGGVEYTCLKADGRSIHATKEATGAVFAKTNMTIVIAIYDEKHDVGSAAQLVEGLANHLVNEGS